MSEYQPYIGEIRMFAGNFPPSGWLFCEGQLLPISENETLFFYIGTTYGGDGESTFALPDLRGRVPVHKGTSYPIGMAAGAEEVTLTSNTIPAHSHTFVGAGDPATSALPTNGTVAFATQFDLYTDGAPQAAMAPASLSPAGGSQPHSNFQPYLCVSFIISLYGLPPNSF